MSTYEMEDVIEKTYAKIEPTKPLLTHEGYVARGLCGAQRGAWLRSATGASMAIAAAVDRTRRTNAGRDTRVVQRETKFSALRQEHLDAAV